MKKKSSAFFLGCICERMACFIVVNRDFLFMQRLEQTATNITRVMQLWGVVWQLLSRQKSCWHQWKFGPIKGLRIRSAEWHEEAEEIQKRQWHVRISPWLTGKWRSYPAGKSAPKARALPWTEMKSKEFGIFWKNWKFIKY